jgi:hypothetical protein
MNLKMLVVAVVVLLSSALSPAARAGSLTTEVVGIFPRDAVQFAFADLRQARSLAWFPELQRQVLPDQLRQFEQLLASPGMDRDSLVEELAWAVVSSGSQPQPSQDSGAPAGEETIIVALGQFSPESTDAYFKAQKRTVVKVRNYFLYPLSGGYGDKGLFVCFMDSTVAVLGGRKELERVIGIRYGEEQSLLSNTDLAPLISQSNGRSVVWGALSAPQARLEMQELVPLIREFPQSQQLLSKLRAFTLEIDAGTGIQSRFEAVCASSDDASTFAALLQADLRYQASRAGRSNQDVTALLDQAKLAPSGDRLDVTLELTDDQVVGLLQSNGFSIHK